MREIYNELRRHDGKLTEFAKVLVEKGLYQDTKNCIATMRNSTKERQDIQAIYDEWKNGKFKTRDVEKYNEKVSNIFKDLKRRSLKDELLNICEVMESALMELTIGIKKDDKTKLIEAKEMLQSCIYGRVSA